MIVWLVVAVFPQLSVTDHVRTIVPQPSTTEFVSLNCTDSVGSQASVAVTLGAAGIAVHSTVTSAGIPTSVGATESTTVIVWLAVAVFAQLSVTDHVRTIVPQPSVTESASLNRTDSVESQASVAVTLGAAGIAVHSTVVSAGTPRSVGATVSTTMIVWLHVATLPHASVAVHVRVTLYACAQLPGVVTSANVTRGLASQRSLTVGVPNTGVAGHSIGDVTAAHVMLGAVVSTTVIVWLTGVDSFPLQSRPVHVRVIEYVPAHDPGAVESRYVTVGLASQASLAVGAVNTGLAGHSIVSSAPSPLLALRSNYATLLCEIPKL